MGRRRGAFISLLMGKGVNSSWTVDVPGVSASQEGYTWRVRE